MSVTVQIILGLLLLIVIYFVVRKVVNLPQIHKFAKLQHERFIHYLHQHETEENKNDF